MMSCSVDVPPPTRAVFDLFETEDLVVRLGGLLLLQSGRSRRGVRDEHNAGVTVSATARNQLPSIEAVHELAGPARFIRRASRDVRTSSVIPAASRSLGRVEEESDREGMAGTSWYRPQTMVFHRHSNHSAARRKPDAGQTR
jgi:hypothetical protein